MGGRRLNASCYDDALIEYDSTMKLQRLTFSFLQRNHSSRVFFSSHFIQTGLLLEILWVLAALLALLIWVRREKTLVDVGSVRRSGGLHSQYPSIMYRNTREVPTFFSSAVSSFAASSFSRSSGLKGDPS